MSEKTRQYETTRQYKAFVVLGGAIHQSVMVASMFPDDFAEAVAQWEPDSIERLVEALQAEKDREGTA